MTSVEELLLEEEELLRLEERAVLAARKTIAFKRIERARRKLLAHLRRVLASRNIELIIATERMLIEGDLLRYTTSTEMEKSLTSAQGEMVAIEFHLTLLADRAKYRFVDDLHRTTKTREGDYPLDTARLGLNSHITRLKNLDRSRLDETEKEMIDVRREYMASARKLYVERQTEALGLGPRASAAV